MSARPYSVIFTTVLLLLNGSAAGAKTNFAYSIEWLCASAETIAVATLDRVTPLGGRGKSRNLVSLSASVSTWIKGTPRAKRLYFSVRVPDPKTVQPLLNRPLLLMLRSTPQGYNHRGHSYHLWPLRSFHGSQLLIDVDAAKPRVYSAKQFQLLRGRRAIVSHCRAAVLAAQQLRPLKPGQPLLKRWLDVPASSEIFRQLYGGSAVYLAVPGRLYPKAKPR